MAGSPAELPVETARTATLSAKGGRPCVLSGFISTMRFPPGFQTPVLLSVGGNNPERHKNGAGKRAPNRGQETLDPGLALPPVSPVALGEPPLWVLVSLLLQ